jgi:uncharacterized membrane-anchored protein
MKTRLLTSILTFLSCFAFCADDKPDEKQLAAFKKAMETFNSLEYKEGSIPLSGGKANIALKDGFKYLDAANARKLLVEVWANPPQVASEVVGVIVPPDFAPTGDNSWAVTVEFKDDGYVKDEEFDSMNFNKVLKEMIEGSKEASKARVAAGYGKMELTGWATQPRYDKGTHKLYWAKRFNVDDAVESLNYDIRVLGRHGYFELSLISDMSHLAAIEGHIPEILSMVDFTDGNRYADYKNGDKTAAYGIAALVTGGVLAKTGFFKVLLLGLAKFAKVGIVAAVALFAWIKRLVTGKKSE